MFTTPAPSAAVSVSSPQAAAPTSSRTSRLRGLSYLRSYTHNHLSSHTTSSTHTTSDNSRQTPRRGLGRSVSYPARTSPDDSSSSQEQPNTNEQSGQEDSPMSPGNVDLGLLGRDLSPGMGERSPARRGQTSRPRGVGRTQSTTENDPTPPTIDTRASKRQNTPNARSPTSASEMPEPQYSSEARNFARLAGPSTTPVAVVPTTHVQPQTSEAPNMTDAQGETSDQPETAPKLPTIRFFPHQDHRQSGRPSLNFSPVTRTLPNESCVIRVGRYSERTGIPLSNPTVPSDADVGFKSKVVSRRHCEFSYIKGSWYIKDVKSSSGTFLNHIRLSQPNQESTLWKVKDGDIVQLGIDFRGGEEMIFRCVKIRVECHRSWQKRVNAFNTNAHAQIRELARTGKSDPDSNDCAICLGHIQPCQSLFVAQCAHVWHYKCIRPLIMDEWPMFNCPNCRAITNLEEEDEGEQGPQDELEQEQSTDNEGRLTNGVADNDHEEAQDDTDSMGPVTGDIDMEDSNLAARAGTNSSIEQEAEEDSRRSCAPSPRPVSSGLLSRRQASNPSSPRIGADSIHDLDIPTWGASTERPPPSSESVSTATGNNRSTTPTLDALSQEGPLTPRNNAGPFVFDGSGQRSAPQEPSGMAT